jgi:hypothetical protein
MLITDPSTQNSKENPSAFRKSLCERKLCTFKRKIRCQKSEKKRREEREVIRRDRSK